MIPKPNNEPVPGEWQTEVNQWGGTRRFRMVGGVKEYELELNTTSGYVSQSKLAAQNTEANKMRLEAYRRKEAEAEAQKRYCPFSSSLHNECSRDKCALFSTVCVLSRGKTAARDTKGLRCPFNAYMCREKCSLYNNGCLLTAAESEV